jgi:hypothetical protein
MGDLVEMMKPISRHSLSTKAPNDNIAIEFEKKKFGGWVKRCIIHDEKGLVLIVDFFLSYILIPIKTNESQVVNFF